MSKIKRHAEQEFGEAWEQKLEDEILAEIEKRAENLEYEHRRKMTNRSPRYSEGPSESHNVLRNMQENYLNEIRDYEARERMRYGD